MTYGFYLYGIFPHPGPRHLNLVGLDKQLVQVQSVDDFVFLYSAAQQERYLASRRNLLDHEKVLEQAMTEGYRTLLPLQFGLIVNDWESVQRDLTAPRAADLQRLFQRLEGQREVGVKVFWENDIELQQMMAENPALRAERDRLEGRTLSMEEVIGIGQAIEQGLSQRQQKIITQFRQTLNPLASAIVENDPLMNTMIYNAAYLIPWDSEPEFNVQVETLDRQFENRLKIRYNNFTAPYNFAQLDQL